MGRRLGSRAGRVAPGLAGAMIARYQLLDRFHLPPSSRSCHWCALVAALKVGKPIEVDADALHPFLDHSEFKCSGPWTHDDDGTYLVTGDRYERLA